ncbi:MAG: hypothetical protein V5A37_00810 [Halobacteriales archaeon]
MHVHFGATGTVPLRLAELFFTDEGLWIVEYGTFTPLFGLASGGPSRAADRMARTFAEDGFRAVRERGDRVVHLAYEDVERVVCHDGGRLARERVAVHVAEGPPYAYRVHADVDLEALAAGLAAFGPTAALPVAVRSGVGFAPRSSLRRFLAGR